MSFKFPFVLPLVMVAVLGCTPHSAANAASGVEGAGGATTPTSSGTQVETIKDPSLNNMTAYNVTIPGKWRFEGSLYQGGTCEPVPNEVYRALTPDGLGYVEHMPALSWQWGTGPAAAGAPKNDCLPLHGAMSTQDFIKHMADILQVHYDGPAPVPDAVNAEAQAETARVRAMMAQKYAAAHLEQPKGSRELGRGYVSYKNGTFAMKGRIDVTVDCTETSMAGQKRLGAWGGPGHPPQLVTSAASTMDKCIASITYMTAPENKFDAMARQWDAHGIGAKGEDAWQQAWVQRNAQQAQQTMRMISNMSQQAMQASAAQFQHDQGVRQQMHEQFLDTMQRGTDMSMARTQQSMNARTTSASDWVDYSLDQRTVADPRTGQLTKISNQATTAWADKSGDVFTSKDPTWDPNKALGGNWVQQNYVHGNGTPQ